jgi:hypothetical protein
LQACELRAARQAGAFNIDPESLFAMQQPVSLEIDVNFAVQLISAVQLACRHPSFKGKVRDSVEAFTRELQEPVSLTPRIRLMIDAGWDQTMDVPAEPAAEQRRIIIPP